MDLCYTGQVHGIDRRQEQRFGAHYSRCAKNKLVEMQECCRRLVARSNDAEAKAQATKMVVHALWVCGKATIAELATAAGVTRNLLTTCLEDLIVSRLDCMVKKAGGNKIPPLTDLVSRVITTGMEDPHHQNVCQRLNAYIRRACDEREF